MYRSLSLLALILGLVEALPTNSGNLSSPTASNPSNVIATEPFPTATGPTCIQTRSPSDPSASDINEAITNDISIKKACDIASQSTTTLNNGLLSVIYYGLDNAYFFNSSHRYSEVNAQVVSPSFCPDTFNNIFSTCVTKGNFWGGWVLNDGTNHSITNFVYPANPLVNGGSGAPAESSGNSAGGIALTATSFNPLSGSQSTSLVGTDTSTTSLVFQSSGGQPPATGTDSGVPHSSASGPLPSISHAGTQPPVTSNPLGSLSPSSLTVSNSAPSESAGSQPTTVQPPVTGTGEAPSLTGSVSTPSSPPDSSKHLPTSHAGQPPTTSLPSSLPVPGSTGITLPYGATVVVTTVSSSVLSETFIPTTFSGYRSLVGTITTSTLDGHSSAVPLLIGPGGIGWAPLSQSSNLPDLVPPTVLPPNLNAPIVSSVTSGHITLPSSLSSNNPSSISGPSQTSGTPAETLAPGTTKGNLPTTGAPLVTITTSYDPEASTVSSIDPGITGNTAIRTSDDHHGLGLYPFWKGGPHCFIICPPGIDNGGIILWGMDKPGIYPPPTPPPFPNIEWPTITINDNLEPTATEEPDDEPTNSGPSESAKSTAPTTSKASTSTATSSSQSSSGSLVPVTQKYILVISTVGLDELKQRNSWMAKFHHLGASTGSATATSMTTPVPSSTSKGSLASSTKPPTTSASKLLTTTKKSSPSSSLNPDCPNNGVDENAPDCPTPTSTSSFSCGLASNVGVVTYDPATWCGCNDGNSYATLSGSHPCELSTPLPSTIHPSAVHPTATAPPTGVPALTDCSLVITTDTGTIAPGPQTYCTCGPVIAGINTKTSSGIVYSICAGDPFPTIASSTLPPPKTTAAPAPKPSLAIIIYREDSCGDVSCDSEGHVYDITPGQPVDPCKDDDIFGEAYTQGAANDDSDYPVNIGPFTSHDIKNVKYSGSNNHEGTLTGDGLPGSPIQCIVPAAQATSCESSHSLDADDFIPIVYCEW